MAITEGTQPAPVTWTGAWSTPQSTASFTPESGALLVALVNGAGTAITATVSDSVGGTTGWVLLRRENTNSSNTQGTAEVWCKNSPGTAMTVSAASSSGTGTGGQLTVRTLIGALASASQNGATASLNNDSPAAVQVSVAAGTGNRVYASAFNWDTSTAMTVLANTTAIAAFADGTNGDNWASCKSSADTAGTAVYGYSTSVRGKIAAAEIKAAAAGTTANAGAAAGAGTAAAVTVTTPSSSGPDYAGAAADLGGGTGSWVNAGAATGTGDGSYATWSA